MSKRTTVAIYLLTIFSGLLWSNVSHAGMDLIETVLLQATGVLQKASGVVEKASSVIEEVTSGKIFDEYYQEYQNMKGKLERAEQRFKNVQERAQNLADRNAGVNEANQKEMDDYNTETSAIMSQVERSRQALIARGRISENYQKQEEDENDSSDVSASQKDIGKLSSQTSGSSTKSTGPSNYSSTMDSKTQSANNTSQSQSDSLNKNVEDKEDRAGNSLKEENGVALPQLKNYENTNGSSASNRKFINADNEEALLPSNVTLQATNSASTEKTNVKK